MAGEILILDAAASNPNGTDPGTALNIGPGTDYALRAFDAPAPPLTIQYAGSVDTEGSLPASRKHENRVISFTVLCATAAALRTLQGKIGKVAREGGTLKWVLPNAEVVIFDLHSADTFEPAVTKMLYVRAGAYCEVEITLSAKPYGRGPEETLSDHTETTLPLLVFTETGIKGDMPALGRLVIDNDDASDAQSLIRWGIRSQYYSSASTAALFYQAESCSMMAAAAAVGPTGASGSGSNTAFYGSLSASPAWSSLIRLGATSTGQTHIGTFNVVARVRAPAANTGVVSVRASWARIVGAAQKSNDGVALYGEDVWYLVNLGQVILPKVVSGTQGWLGSLDAQSTVANDDIYVDWIAFFPAIEGAGEDLNFTTTLQIPASGTTQIRYDGAFTVGSSGHLAPLSYYEGDNLLIPPAGLEGRTLEVIVKMARGDLITFLPGTTDCFADPGIDDLSARLYYTPRYLVVPSA